MCMTHSKQNQHRITRTNLHRLTLDASWSFFTTTLYNHQFPNNDFFLQFLEGETKRLFIFHLSKVKDHLFALQRLDDVVRPRLGTNTHIKIRKPEVAVATRFANRERASAMVCIALARFFSQILLYGKRNMYPVGEHGRYCLGARLKAAVGMGWPESFEAFMDLWEVENPEIELP